MMLKNENDIMSQHILLIQGARCTIARHGRRPQGIILRASLAERPLRLNAPIPTIFICSAREKWLVKPRSAFAATERD